MHVLFFGSKVLRTCCCFMIDFVVPPPEVTPAAETPREDDTFPGAEGMDACRSTRSPAM